LRRFAVFTALAAAGLLCWGPSIAIAGTSLPEAPEVDQLYGLTASEYFGRGLDLTGDQLLVGALARSEGDTPGVGGVYEFRRTPGTTGPWTLHKILLNRDHTGDQGFTVEQNFGSGVSRSGDYAVFGATGRTTLRYGSVFPYYWDDVAKEWVEEPEIKNPVCLLADREGCPDESEEPQSACPRKMELARQGEFGSAVAISGKVTLISAPYEDLCFLNPDTFDPPSNFHCSDPDQGEVPCRIVNRRTKTWVGTDTGVAYIYRRDDVTGWELEQRLEPEGLALVPRAQPTANGNIVTDEYTRGAWGRRDGMLDLEGDFAVIGDDERKRVWVYKYNSTLPPGEGPWELLQVVEQPSSVGTAFIGFGTSVSIRGNWLAVGADFADIPNPDTPPPELPPPLTNESTRNLGAVFMYRLIGGVFWQHDDRISPVLLAGQTAWDQFGRDVELSDDTLVGGTMPHVMDLIFNERTGGTRQEPGKGAAWVFDFDSNPAAPSLTERYKVVAPDGLDYAGFGASIAYSDDGTLIVAAPQRSGKSYESDPELQLEFERRTPFTGAVYTYDLEIALDSEGALPEPSQGYLALAALGTLALLRRRLRPSR
jgi:hypothetical protein